jgi:small ligand-binding sensory domain FIST
MRCVTALSQHPIAAEATAEVVGQVLERDLGRRDLVVLFCSAHHLDSFSAITSTVRSLLEPGRLVGATAQGIVGGEREVEDGPALSLWAADLGAVPPPVRLTAASTSAGVALQGLPPEAQSSDQTVMLMADPFSLPMAEVLDVFAAGDEPTPVLGGLVSAAMTPGGNRLALDDEVFADGAVGAVLDATTTAVVSQGCRPVGSPMIVTQAEGNQVIELAGKSALSRLEQLATSIAPEERALLANGVHLGVVADEHQAAFGRGDFLVRSVMGADRGRGALSVGSLLEVGTTVQFHVRDASSADDDLRALLTGHHADGALLFTCNGRGRELFGTPDHDAGLVADVTRDGAVAGMFCAGEVGPVGGRSFLHGFTACVLLFGDTTSEPVESPTDRAAEPGQ